jgi:hypothetical protein
VYNFEVAVQDGEHDVNIAAMRFVRDQYQPSLTIWMSHVWVVQPSRQGHWMRAVPANENTTTNTTLTIDLASDVEYLMYKPAAPAETADTKINKTAEQLILVLKGGRMLTLSGGMYFPGALVHQAFSRRNYFRSLKERSSSKANTKSPATKDVYNKKRMRQQYVESASFKANTITPATKDAYLDVLWEPLVGFSIMNIVTPPLTIAAPLTIPMLFHVNYWNPKRELQISPAAKMFQKLRCLAMFKSCRWGVENLVLTSKTCQKPLALS